MSNIFKKGYNGFYTGVQKMLLLFFPFLSTLLLPDNILAAESAQTTKPPTAGAGLLVWLICYWNRKKSIGGWLLYYFITLFISFFISIALTLPSETLSNFNPMNWDDKFGSSG